MIVFGCYIRLLCFIETDREKGKKYTCYTIQERGMQEEGKYTNNTRQQVKRTIELARQG